MVVYLNKAVAFVVAHPKTALAVVAVLAILVIVR